MSAKGGDGRKPASPAVNLIGRVPVPANAHVDGTDSQQLVVVPV
jgi:hypothetical protein